MDILVVKFFPKTKIVDFSNIKNKATINQRVLNISSIILAKEINKLIRNLLNGKALGLNGILNKVLKVVALVIAKDLIKITSNCFTNGIILKSLKEFIIMVLHKKERKNLIF